jgi:1,4-dihydroxy-2-naphthoyl-CoA hydrolase
MAIWRHDVKLEDLNERGKGTLVEHIGIEFLELGDDFIKARMPVDHRTVQPFGVLHGGASVVLAETLGSVAANICVESDKKCFGIEINANHVNTASSGYVYGTVNPVHIGKTTHVWEIRITNERDNLVCISRITMAVLER